MEKYKPLNNDLPLFINLLCGSPMRKPYPIFEEVSAPGFRWTCLHYAFHYGIWNIIKFILDYLYPLNLGEIALSIKSKDNRCPLLCLLKSNKLKSSVKRDIFKKVISTYPTTLSEKVRKEVNDRGFSDLL